MFERFTHRARRAVIAAVQQAQALGHGSVGPEHLLLGLAADPDGIAGRVLAEYGVQHAEAVRRVRAGIDRSVRRAGLDEAEVAALADLGIDVEEVVARAEESFGPGALVPRRAGRSGRHPLPGRRLLGRAASHLPLHGRVRRTLPFRPEARQALERALIQAREMGHPALGTEHILLGLLAGHRGAAYDLLASYGIDYPGARAAVLACLRRAS
jgi:ATP-dependent Clp protease ATP-binding subunit ClpA